MPIAIERLMNIPCRESGDPIVVLNTLNVNVVRPCILCLESAYQTVEVLGVPVRTGTVYLLRQYL